jgi:hypothetical protein
VGWARVLNVCVSVYLMCVWVGVLNVCGGACIECVCMRVLTVCVSVYVCVCVRARTY